jgi:hypothetical protein
MSFMSNHVIHIKSCHSCQIMSCYSCHVSFGLSRPKFSKGGGEVKYVFLGLRRRRRRPKLSLSNHPPVSDFSSCFPVPWGIHLPPRNGTDPVGTTPGSGAGSRSRSYLFSGLELTKCWARLSKKRERGRGRDRERERERESKESTFHLCIADKSKKCSKIVDQTYKTNQ